MQILDLLWNLAHLPHVSREMVELALDAHSSILIESYSTKEGERRTYIGKCVEDIRKVRTFFNSNPDTSGTEESVHISVVYSYLRG